MKAASNSMRSSDLVVGALLSSALLTACGGGRSFSPPISLAPSAVAHQASGSSPERVLYRFQGGKDGANPLGAPVADADGNLYGTTLIGGGSTCSAYKSPAGCGTVFRIDTSGNFKVIHRFPDNAIGGSQVAASLLDAGGKLYGTTQWGGSSEACRGETGCGSVYSIDPRGDRFTKLYAFSQAEGYALIAGVVAVGNTLYGATFGGGYGSPGCGLIFSLTGSTEQTLHEFCNSGNDGNGEYFAPIAVGSTLYGVTAFGGGTTCTSPSGPGCGVVYKYDTSLSGNGYKIIYRFRGGKDGATPNNVIDANGAFYGTTGAGGGTPCTSGSSAPGCGTIFQMDAAGKEHILYRFKGGANGSAPNALLADNAGTLFGDTSYGGNPACQNGCGVVFKFDTSTRKFSVLYRFTGGSDGANPYFNGPIDVGGTLYGTTYSGGGSGCGGTGCGTAFSVAP